MPMEGNARWHDELYKDGLKKFTAIVKRLIESSIAATNVDAGQQQYWASIT